MSLTDQQWCPTSVQVTVLQARGLRVKGKSGTNDAYAVMQVGKEKHQTSVVEKSVAPVWKEEAAFDLPPTSQGGTLHVHVLHRALVGPDKPLGQAVINLLQLSEDRGRNKTEWFKLLDKTGKADKDRGEVLLDIQFMRNNMTASMFDLSAAGKSRSRLSKFKDKVRGKKKETDSVSSVVSSFTQVLTDSEEEGLGDGEVAAEKDEKKKKHKMKSLFSPKSNLQRNMSQSLTVLPASSSSSGLSVEASEGKKKFKFKIHKRSGSSGNKDSSSGLQKHSTVEQNSVCINGSHVYSEEPQTPGSNFSLTSSGHGSMEDVRERQYSPWMEEEEDEADVENLKENVDEEDENIRKQEIEVGKLAEEKGRQEEKERQRIQEQKVKMEEVEKNEEEERKRREYEERLRREEEDECEKVAEEKRKLEEQRRRRTEEENKQREEEERKKMEEKRAQEKEEEERMRREEEHKISEEKKRLEEEERRKAAEENMRKEDEERKRREQEKAEEEERIRKEQERRQKEEERAKKEKEEYERLVEEERNRIEAEEKVKRESEQKARLEEERRRKEEEEERIMRQEEEQEEKRRLEEQERRRNEEKRQREEQERTRRQEEKAKEEENYRLAEQKRRQKEQERIEEEERIRKEEQERIRMEEEKRRQEEEERVRKEREEARRLAEEKRQQEEKERLEEEEKTRIREQERIRMEDEKRRQEEEERVRKEREELKRLAEEKRQQEEKKRLEEEEKTRIREEERIRMEDEKRRQEEEERVRKEREELKRLAEEKRKRGADKKVKKIEERIRMEKELTRDTKEQNKEENKSIHGEKSEVKESKVSMESPAEVTSTNPFDDSYNPFEDNPDSSDGLDSSTVSNERCQSAVSSMKIKTISSDEKYLISTQREKRPAPQPPGRNQAERPCQREADVSTRHVAQTNKQSHHRDVKTASVLPVSRPPIDTKSSQSLVQSTSNGAASAAGHRKGPAPPRPSSVAEEPSSKPTTASPSVGNISPSALEAKQVYSLNPFEDDEDENESEDDVTTSGDAHSVWPQTKVKSSKVARAPPPPAPQACATEPEAKTSVQAQKSPEQETQAVAQNMQDEASVKKKVPPTASRRLQPVKPLSPLDQQSVSGVQGEKDGKSTGILKIQDKTKASGAELKGPFSQLTQGELISLVLKQEKQLSERDHKISELEQYIDNLLVRVMEEKPSILMSMNCMRKTV